jgi:hypothetical protein
MSKKKKEIGLPSLEQHMKDTGSTQTEAKDTVAAIREAMNNSSQGIDWDAEQSDVEDSNQWMKMLPDQSDEDPWGEENFDGGGIDGDIEIITKDADMSQSFAAQEAIKLTGMANIAAIKITEEMIKEQFGDEHGGLIWEEVVASTVLERIVLPGDLPKSDPGEKEEYFEEQTGRGIKLRQRKHQVSRTMQAFGDYVPETMMGLSRSQPERKWRRKKDKGGNSFFIYIDVSSSNGSISDPNSNMNCVITAAVALIREAEVLEYPVSLYINPNLYGSIPGDSPLADPKTYPLYVVDNVDIKNADQVRKQKGKKVMVAADIDPRYYHYESTDYEKIIYQLTRKVKSGSCETPRQAMGRILYDMKRSAEDGKKGGSKDNKKTLIWLADCTRTDEYLSVPGMLRDVEELGEMWIFCISGWKNEDMINVFGEGMDDRRFGDYITFVDIPNAGRGANPDRIPGIIAEKLGLKHVEIKADNVLRKMV